MKKMNRRKKLCSMMMALGLAMLTTACAGQTTTTETTTTDAAAAESTAIDNSSTEIAVLTQEYIGNNIGEILFLSYDETQADLQEYGGKNPEIESLNHTIANGIATIYNDYMANTGDDSWIEVRSYPFTSEAYLQIVTTYCQCPTYAIDGNLYSYNFDRKNNKFLSVDDALADLKLDKDTVSDTASGMIQDYYPDANITVESVDVAGFLIQEGASGPLTQLLLQVNATEEGAGDWEGFFGYTPALNELIRLNGQCLFDPSQMDQMNPPLSYQEGWGADAGDTTGGNNASSAYTLSFNTDGMDEIVPGQEYSLDGMVWFTVDTPQQVEYSEDAVLANIKSLEGEDIRLITLTPAEEYSDLLSYPAWLIVYETGENEDTRECQDVYVQTDIGDYRVHISIPADFVLDYTDEVGRRLATLSFTET